jgi:hypothetical protein
MCNGEMCRTEDEHVFVEDLKPGTYHGPTHSIGGIPTNPHEQNHYSKLKGNANIANFALGGRKVLCDLGRVSPITL